MHLCAVLCIMGKFRLLPHCAMEELEIHIDVKEKFRYNKDICHGCKLAEEIIDEIDI